MAADLVRRLVSIADAADNAIYVYSTVLLIEQCWPSAAEAVFKRETLIAALKRCATQSKCGKNQICSQHPRSSQNRD
jgi:hypothetical protein